MNGQTPLTQKEIEGAALLTQLLKNHKPTVTKAGDGWLEVSLPPHPTFANSKNYQKETGIGFLICMVEKRNEDGRWHMSISHNIPPITKGMNIPGRYPTWEEIRDARYKFVPDEVNMAIMFPPSGLYYNRHETCIHLVEVPVEMALDPKARGGI